MLSEEIHECHSRYRKKIEKDEEYIKQVKALGDAVRSVRTGASLAETV